MGIISRCLVLDRADRYLGNAAPQIRFRNDFQVFCLAALEKPGHIHPLFLDWFQRNKLLSMRGHTLETLSKNSGASPSSGTNLMATPDLKDRVEGFLGRFRDTTLRIARRLMVTNDGHIGIAPCRARKGDIVCVLLGCSIPLVLRPRGDKKTYEFIGECYLHEFMNGEAVGEVESGKRMMKSIRPA